MDQMKRLSELAAKMAENTSVENTQTSSNTNLSAMQPLTITCFDPHNPAQPCPICRGMGVIKYDVTPDDPRFGKLFRCPNNPVEVDENRQVRLRKISNLEVFKDKTLDNFIIDVPTYTREALSSLDMALKKAITFAMNPSGWVVLEGSYGTGKTHLAAAIGNVRLIQGDVVLFITVPDLLDHLRSTFAPNSDTAYDELFNRVRNADLLILDDIGTENPSEWAREKLFQILNYRYVHKMGTVITTNVKIDNLDPRIRSRMIENDRIVIKAPDFRNLNHNQNEQVMSTLEHYGHMTFNNFEDKSSKDPEIRENIRRVAQSAYAYAQGDDDGRAWVLLMGGYGCGKTHLAAAIGHQRQFMGQEVMFITVPDLLDYLRTTFDPNADTTFDKLFNQIRNVPLLILDDLGTESTKPWAQEKLFQILDYRYVKQLSTVITTSKEMKDINERIASRLLDQRICRNLAIIAPSYAKRMNNKR